MAGAGGGAARGTIVGGARAEGPRIAPSSSRCDRSGVGLGQFSQQVEEEQRQEQDEQGYSGG